MEHPEVRRIQVVVLAALLCMVSSPVWAIGHVGIPFEVMRVMSAQSPGQKSISWGICTSYFSQEFRPSPGQQYMENRTTVSFGTGYMVTDKLGVGLLSELVRSTHDVNDSWTGRVNLEGKAGVFEASSVCGAITVLSSIPVYTSNGDDESVALTPKLLVTYVPKSGGSLPPYNIHLNLGYAFSADGEKLDDLLLLGLGVELEGKHFTPFMEITSEQAVHDSSLSVKENPLRLTPGLKWRPLADICVGLAIDLSLSEPPLPGLKLVEDWQVIVSIWKS